MRFEIANLTMKDGRPEDKHTLPDWQEILAQYMCPITQVSIPV